MSTAWLICLRDRLLRSVGAKSCAVQVLHKSRSTTWTKPYLFVSIAGWLHSTFNKKFPWKQKRIGNYTCMRKQTTIPLHTFRHAYKLLFFSIETTAFNFNATKYILCAQRTLRMLRTCRNIWYQHWDMQLWLELFDSHVESQMLCQLNTVN